ncbi:uncharacterized protein LOC111353097 isoform X1 [Spodoptera litura]|uniref:Uncharacterized protein LOC111353097 isoform X1 n=1 Tax=Spodoptera litura TaxID=69820 RepID=A0A9J7E582_SPOLT|nr:uncharacterized protein LOC111353097 isoform X1 [Spodoptera litura]XP_022821718.1 uncharacterized protein LOC111353097 isoform X1 [Spodoptera litura]
MRIEGSCNVATLFFLLLLYCKSIGQQGKSVISDIVLDTGPSRSRSSRSRSRSRHPSPRTRSPSVQCHTPSHSAIQQPSNIQNIEISQVLVDEAPETVPNETEENGQQQETGLMEIDTDIISAMGAVEEGPVSGPSAHNEIVQRWTPILSKGLKKEDKAMLLKEYAPFHNIPAMVPPKLNPELSAAVSEPVKKRDMIIEYRQKNVAAALAAVGCGLESFMFYNKVEGIKRFNDAAKILCDLLHSETQSRRALIANVINKELKESLQGSPDAFLFGEDLTERIKVAKAVQRSAQDLGTTPAVVKQNNTNRNQRPLNSRVPPQPGYRRLGFNKTKTENHQSGGGKKPYSQKKTRRPPPPPRHQHERSYHPRK